MASFFYPHRFISTNSMLRTYSHRTLSAGTLMLLSACAAHPPVIPPATETPQVTNDFPTQARVEYVLQCMDQHGGQNFDNLYHCICAIDKLAEKFHYQELSEAQTFTYLYDTPGERGAEFRDPPHAKILRDKLKDARKTIDSVCFPALPKNSTSRK